MFALFQLSEAEIHGVTLYQKPSYVKPINRSIYNQVSPLQQSEMGMGIVKAIFAVLAGLVEAVETNADATIGRVRVLSASTNQPHLLSWNMSDPLDALCGGFKQGKPTYHLAILHIIACLLNPQGATLPQTSEVVQRWHSLLRAMEHSYPRPPVQASSWDVYTQLRPASSNSFTQVFVEELADALYFSMRYQLPPAAKLAVRRTIGLVETDAVPAHTWLSRRLHGSSLLVLPSAAQPGLRAIAAVPAAGLANRVRPAAPNSQVPSPGSLVYCTHCQQQTPDSDPFCAHCGGGWGQGAPAGSGAGLSPLAPSGVAGQPGVSRGRFTDFRQIGSGGMGQVHRARDAVLERYVALKELLVANQAAEFKKEALLLAGLSHPNIPRVHDYIEEGGRAYLVMEFIEGETLEDYLVQRGGRLPAREVAEIGITLCGVLTYLHTRQPPIIYRDLKPANIMRTPDGYIYLIDFGIARTERPGNDTLALGSLGYAAPEQCGKTPRTSPRTDLYALGATMHALLTGCDPSEQPFRFDPFLRPPLAVQAPPTLERLVLSMVEMDTAKRPASAASVMRELQQIQRGVLP